MNQVQRTVNQQIFEFDFQGKKLIFEIDQLTSRGEKSILCRYGDTTVLTVLCSNSLTADNFVNFLPLTVFFEEKFYAVGKIPGSFSRREGKPSYESVIIARLIDRSLRGLFPQKLPKEIQITNNVLSVDPECDPRLVACWNSALAAFLCPDLHFDVPLATVIITQLEKGKFIFNPTNDQLTNSLCEIIVSVTEAEKIVMLELSAQEISEEELINALQKAQAQIKILTGFFKHIHQTLDITKNQEEQTQVLNMTNFSSEEEIFIKEKINNYLIKTLSGKDFWLEKEKKLKEICPQVVRDCFKKNLVASLEIIRKFVELTYEKLLKEKMYQGWKEKNQRLDGRGSEDIRPLNIQIDYLPNVHGSALFARGETKVLSVITLGKRSEKQLIDSIFTQSYKYFLHHYNFPAFAVNEISNFKSTSRREIGHGQLVEKTFRYLLPSPEIFPYTIRVVSEVFSSDGSSSQASICATSLVLMLAGVPGNKMVAGIALGLLDEQILIDINGLEDALGEMDFKIAGTEKGICSLQLDVKNHGISFDIFKKSLEKGKKARLFILQEMKKYISQPRSHLPTKAIKYKNFYVGEEKLSIIVGRGGKTINNLIQETGIVIDLQPNGYVLMYHQEAKQLEKAWKLIQELLRKSAKY